MSREIFLLIMGVFGLVFGSFANVVIWRFPRKESLNTPPSHCPSCDTPIQWRDNIPVLSWLLLRGRCRACGAVISRRYPAVELLSGALWVLAGAVWGMTAQCAFAVAFYYFLMLLAFIDVDTMRLPNPLVGTLAVIGVIGASITQFFGVPAAPLIPVLDPPSAPLLVALDGALVGGGLSLAIALAYSAVRKTSGFGMGDVKLLAAIGLFTGWFSLLVLFIGSLIGAVIGIALMSSSKDKTMTSKIPFGPSLAAAAVLVSVVGPALWTWYAGLLGA